MVCRTGKTGNLTLKQHQQFRIETNISIISDSMQIYGKTFFQSIALQQSTNISFILASK